jgi:uncharacterized protein YdaU (DUF1376 family)
MSDGPWIKFYPSDWLLGTSGMSAAEIGVYVTLVSMMYEKGKPIILDSSVLARRCGLAVPAFSKILQRLIDGQKVRHEGGGLFNERVEKELHERLSARDRASASAKVKWEKEKEKQGDEDADAMRPLSTRAARQIPEVRKQSSEREPQDSQLELIPDDSSELVDNSVSAVSAKRAPTERGTSLPRDWVLPKGWGEWALGEFPFLSRESVLGLANEFKDYWIGVPGQRGRKRDWEATWRNRVREKAAKMRGGTGAPRQTRAAQLGDELRQELHEQYGPGREANGDLPTSQRLLAVGGKVGP